ncbi:hypothetical protein ILYODFUR_003332 [Ilyodon furcidens]|uniref:Uncharacterized protein n=1 Tax=Ilyodon furcidens TaxID=33524 RepID=A0ABV0V2I4_9TELE
MDESPTVQEEGKRTGENRELNETEGTTSNNNNQVNGLLSRCGQVTKGRGIRDPGCQSGVRSDDFLGAVCVNLEISEFVLQILALEGGQDTVMPWSRRRRKQETTSLV